MLRDESFRQTVRICADLLYHTAPQHLTAAQLHDVLGRAIVQEIDPVWQKSRAAHADTRRAYYFSAEFLLGRLIFNNLLCLGIQKDELCALANELEEIEDAALGNGGLGRLAACFLDSAATLWLPLDGYGIRYKYGLFRQKFEDGFQTEYADDWTRQGDPWSVRNEGGRVRVAFKNQTVDAIPYDTPIIGYGGTHISTLRLWQAEEPNGFDFQTFNDGKYDRARRARDRAEDISAVLYPNDATLQGKRLRYKQQYFFCSASLQDILRTYKAQHGSLDGFADRISIQLNDTHPVISIPELIRILWDEEKFTFDAAVETAAAVFNYTNHTVMPEALEKWDFSLINGTTPRIAAILKILDRRLEADLRTRADCAQLSRMAILQNKTVHMANLAVYLCAHVNGVAQIHTEILQNSLLADWYALFPERFQNKTNGITQRRWLALCNPRLSTLITELLGSNAWITDLDRLKQLEKFADDPAVLDRLIEIKRANRRELAAYIKRRDGIEIDPDTIFDLHIKRLHEYKRQLLNILSILALAFELKDGNLPNFHPTTFLFGAKAAPGYFRAKAIIKLIHEVARWIESDPEVANRIKVVFVSNYNVSYAEKLIPAADVSVQMSTAGTEASGTGNMKLMLNGAVTLGTYDGANIEIVEQAGKENNYIFGKTVEELAQAKAGYAPAEIYKFNPKIARVLDMLINGQLDDGGTGMFRELYDSLLAEGDRYFLLLDFESCMHTRMRLNSDFSDRRAMARKALLNIANSGKFSSDRTIREYARDFWQIEKVL